MRIWPLRIRVTRTSMYGPLHNLSPSGAGVRHLERGWRVQRWGPGGSGQSESTSLRFAWKHAPRCHRVHHVHHPRRSAVSLMGVVWLAVSVVEAGHGHAVYAATTAVIAMVVFRLRHDQNIPG